MTRLQADRIEVQRGQIDGVEGPARFLWDERLYVVRAVLDQWVEAGAWWRPADRQPGAAGELAGSGPAGELLGSGPAGDLAGSGVNDRERELWRVEAAAGRSAPTGVFDLCFDWSLGQWSLVRVHD